MPDLAEHQRTIENSRSAVESRYNATEAMKPIVPTPETHRYVGMWRPPFEQVPRKTSCPLCHKNTYFVVDNSYHCPSGCAPDTTKIYECYMAGHFDVPQYELKTTTNHGA